MFALYRKPMWNDGLSRGLPAYIEDDWYLISHGCFDGPDGGDGGEGAGQDDDADAGGLDEGAATGPGQSDAADAAADATGGYGDVGQLSQTETGFQQAGLGGFAGGYAGHGFSINQPETWATVAFPSAVKGLAKNAISGLLTAANPVLGLAFNLANRAGLFEAGTNLSRGEQAAIGAETEAAGQGGYQEPTYNTPQLQNSAPTPLQQQLAGPTTRRFGEPGTVFSPFSGGQVRDVAELTPTQKLMLSGQF